MSLGEAVAIVLRIAHFHRSFTTTPMSFSILLGFMGASRNVRRLWASCGLVGRIGACITGLIWPLTFAWGCTLSCPGGVRLALYGGSLNFVWSSVSTATDLGVHLYQTPPGAAWWWPQLQVLSKLAPQSSFQAAELFMPLWLVALGFAALGVIGSWYARPPLEGVCRACQYQLSGLPGAGQCPECGRHFSRRLRERPTQA